MYLIRTIKSEGSEPPYPHLHTLLFFNTQVQPFEFVLDENTFFIFLDPKKGGGGLSLNTFLFFIEGLFSNKYLKNGSLIT